MERPMSPVREAGLTALREMRRNLGSTKGIAMFVLFFLGGAVPSVVRILFMKIVDQGTMVEASEEMKRQFFEQQLLRVYDADIAHYLSAAPWTLFLLFKGTLVFVPLLILLIGFDQIAGEIQHRSIRYIAGRSRRESIVAGKALGVWGVISAMMLVLHLTVWIVMIAEGGTPVSAVLAWGPRFWLFSVASAGAYVGLTALVSSLFRTPIVALFVGIAVFFAVWLTSTILGLFPSTKPGTWAFPSSYDSLLVSNQPLHVVGGFAALIGWGALMVAIAAVIVKRRDV